MMEDKKQDGHVMWLIPRSESFQAGLYRLFVDSIGRRQ